MKLVSEILPSVAARRPEAKAVIDGALEVSYSGLCSAVHCLAQDILRAGLVPGARIGLLLPNSAEFVAAYFSIVTAGAVVVPLNDHYQESEIRYFIEECGIEMILTSPSHEPLCRRVLEATGSACRVVCIDSSAMEGLIKNDHFRLPSPPEIDPSRPVMYQFSSGSTGRPKRITRNHRNLLFELESFRRTLDIRADDRFLGVAPFSHVNGLMRSMMACLYAGATLYPVARFERQAVSDLIRERMLTVFIAVPFMFGTLAKSRFASPPDFSSLRFCVSASAPMPVNVNREFHAKFGRYVRQLYGSTETGTISVNLSPRIEQTLDSVGSPIEGVEIRVFDDHGRPVPVGETGELAVRSPAAISGYEGLEEVNREAFREGFFFTGDLGRQDADGLFYLVGRKKFFINKGGYKINPQEIEQLLETHPGIEEVAVVGVPTPFEDEKVKAVVVAKEPMTVAELIEFCAGRIADFKIPSVIEFRDSLPKSPTGKVRKKLLVD